MISDELKTLTEKYISTTEALLADKKFGEGIFGMPDRSKSDPCHVNYFNAVKDVIEKVVAAGLSRTDADDIAEFLLRGNASHPCNNLASWMIMAVEQFSLQIIPFMSDSCKDDLSRFYSKKYPRLQRIPFQQQIVKALKK